MRLTDLLSQFPGARLATPEDNERILRFFESASMHGSAFDVLYRRRPDFFRLLRYRSDRAFVIASDDGRGGVNGVGSISLRPGWDDGKPTTVGYLGDLRIAFDRAVSRRWRALFTAIVARSAEIEELADCTRWFTTVLDDNLGARAALSRGAQPALAPIGPFTMRNLVARSPLARRRACGPWRIGDAGASALPALETFFERENRCLPLGFRGELARRLACWESLAIDDFVYAEDDAGLLACLAPWSPGAAKQTVVSQVPASLRWLGLLAGLLPTPRLRIPEAGAELRMLYLTHLTFAARLQPAARTRLFRDLVDHVFDRWRGGDWHLIALCDFQQWDLGSALGGFVQHTVPITLYEVLPVGRPSSATPTSAPPAFEMAMV